MKTTYLLCGIAAAILILPTACAADILRVNTQSEFNALPENIRLAVSNGATDIQVELAPTKFQFKDNFLNWKDLQWPDVAITIHGDNTTIAAGGAALRNGQDYTRKFNHGNGYTAADSTDIPLWGDLHEADGLVDILNTDTKLCRLPYADIADQDEADCANTYINVTQWYKSSVYKVQRIERGNIYFTAADLSYNDSRHAYNVNLDNAYSAVHRDDGGLMPRFRLCNSTLDSGQLVCIRNGKISLPQGVEQVQECTATRLITITNSRLRSLTLSGINFCGNRDNGLYLISMKNVKAADSIAINGCHFSAIRSGVIQAESCSNLRVAQCTFRSCYRNGVFAYQSADTRVTHCTFDNMGLACINTHSIRCSGQDYYIAYNEFRNFGYNGIALGTWWQAEKTMPETGVVEHNHLYYTPEYMASCLKRTLMDTGAIYFYTQNDDATVRRNLIHDYTGACDNRGIFCDDGAAHMRIYENIIFNTPNCYSIDSRSTPNIAKSKKSKTNTVNFDNKIYDNTIDGPIRAESREKNNQCRFGPNKKIKKGTNIPDLIQKSNIFAPHKVR